MDQLLKHKLILLLIAIFILSLTGGTAAMMVDKDGNMLPCPLMNSGSFCGMGVLAHIEIFQSIFRSVLMTLPWLSVLLLFMLPIFKLEESGPNTNNKLSLFPKLVQSNSPVFNKFLFALSNGIIQSKLYA